MVAAVKDQVEQFTHTCFMITPYEGYVAVAEQLNRLTPGGHEKRSALFNSGAEAVENAVKIARAYTKKQAVAAFDHAYHGRTNLAMALTAKSMPYKHSFGPFAPEVYRAPLSYPYRDEKLMDGELAARRAIDVIDKQVGPANLAAVIIEPIQGEGGFIVPAIGIPSRTRRWCRARVVASLPTRYRPDSRAPVPCSHASSTDRAGSDRHREGIAGGFPLAAVTGRLEYHGRRHVAGWDYGGNPVACAGGSVVLPLKALVLNMLSLSATLGAMVFIFQEGHLKGLVATSPPSARSPHRCRCHVLPGVRAVDGLRGVLAVPSHRGISRSWRHQRCGDVRAATCRTHRYGGSTHYVDRVPRDGHVPGVSHKGVGVGLTLAILVDATLIRVALLPAAMPLLGSANWWTPAPFRALLHTPRLTAFPPNKLSNARAVPGPESPIIRAEEGRQGSVRV